MRTCENCGTPIVRCDVEHPALDLCVGWRHVYDDPALFHSILCATSTTRDDRGWQVAYPATDAEVQTSIGFTNPAAIVLMVALGLVVLAVILDAVFGWYS